jgi:hypothetical protein
MSREYVNQRLRQLGVERRPRNSRGYRPPLGPTRQAPDVPDNGAYWSLTAGCWMYCDFQRGMCERVTEPQPEKQP